MVPLINASHYFLYSHLKFPLINPETRKHNLPLDNKSCSLELKRRVDIGSWCCLCKRWESDVGLEGEVLEFMKKSAKPEVFPSKKDLVDGGRMDLVDAIRKKGGWLSIGWDDNDEDIGELETRLASFEETNSVPANSSQSASSSGRPLEKGAEEDMGIEGILTRLEKERNLSLGITLGKSVYHTGTLSKDDGNQRQLGTSTDEDRADLEKNSQPVSGSPSRSVYYNDLSGKLSCNGSIFDVNGSQNSVNPEMWRTWSIQRAGFSDMEFEAAEISFRDNQTEGKREDSKDRILALREGATEASDGRKEIDRSQIQTRLQNLELELASVLRLLRSECEEFVSKGHESSSSDSQNLSDEWEFQENELMHAQHRLRSLRAKLAVLEGKMALSLIDAQKIAEEKQKRIDGAQKALQLLRNACIVWPNSASEVLITGSFDGWTTQRKMEKSSTGIFSVDVKLYPGRYEIKFIVDGVWMIDPLRPTVRNNGYENNLLIIT